MQIELKSSGPITLSGIPITLVSLDLDTGIVEYIVDGVGLGDIKRAIHETLLSNIFIDGSGKRWSLRRVVPKDERPECKGSGKV